MSSTDVTHVFLSHNWGLDKRGRDNHARVKRINDALKLLGYKTWFDGEKMAGNIINKIIKGIDNTKAVIVFLTQKYYEKVNGDNENDNCKLEFDYATNQKRASKIIPVIMDSSMKQTSSWKGVISLYLGKKMYIDMSEDIEDPNYLKSQIQLLSKELKEIGIEPDDARTKPLGDVIPQVNMNKNGDKSDVVKNQSRSELFKRMTDGLAINTVISVKDGADDVVVGAEKNNDDGKTTNVSNDFDSYTEADIKQLILNSNIEKLKSLSSQWPNAIIKNLDNKTPLIWASDRGFVDIVKILIDSGANVNVGDRYNQTPLYYASHRGHVDVVKILIDSGANVHVVNSNNRTPLHDASHRGHVDVVKILIDSGANVHVVDRNNETPLHTASYKGHADIVKILIDSGANVHVVDRDNRTPLHWASHRGHVDVVAILIDSGANVHVVDRDNRTPLHYASRRGRADVVAILKKHGAVF